MNTDAEQITERSEVTCYRLAVYNFLKDPQEPQETTFTSNFASLSYFSQYFSCKLYIYYMQDTNFDRFKQQEYRPKLPQLTMLTSKITIIDLDILYTNFQ